jgi:hypothetical protein
MRALVLIALLGCDAPGRTGEDGFATFDLTDPCNLQCTGFSAGGGCYCQTTCHGPVEIFTCSAASGTCICQGGNRPDHDVPGPCNSRDAAYVIYHMCFP